MKKKTKKSHYIPQFYLKYFTQCTKNNKDCRFWAYDVKTKKFFSTGTGGIFFEKYFYGLVSGSNDELAQTIEEKLSKQENKCKDIFDKISKKILNYSEIKNDLLDEFIDCAISLFVRTKDFKDQANFQKKDIIKMTLDMAKENNSESINNTPIEEIEKNLKNVDENNLEFFRQSKTYGKTLDILKIKKMTFFIIPENSVHGFFVGNQPFFDIFKENAKFGENSVLFREQFFVLSPKILIKFSFPFVNKTIPSKNEDIIQMFDDMKKGINFKRFKRKRVEDDYEIMRLNNKISLRQYEFLVHKDKEYIENFFKWITLTKEVLKKYENEN